MQSGTMGEGDGESKGWKRSAEKMQRRAGGEGEIKKQTFKDTQRESWWLKPISLGEFSSSGELLVPLFSTTRLL